MSGIAPEDRLRADLYNFLGVMLAKAPDRLLLDQTAQLSGDDTALGRAITALAGAAQTARPRDVAREFNALFIGLGRGELLPYASYYLTGFLNEKPLARLRGDLARLRIARAPDTFEPEDNAASLLETMGGMIVGRFGEDVALGVQKDFFAKHMGPWMGHFFDDLSKAKTAEFYTHVGAVGAAFMEIEKEAFRLAA